MALNAAFCQHDITCVPSKSGETGDLLAVCYHVRNLHSAICNELFCAFVAVQRGPHYEDVGSPKYSEVI